MNVFEAVKQSVTTRQAAEHYGIHVGRNGMACCPFHNDKTPSMKLDRRYHCFGCGADGDVIDFTAALYGLGKKEAAMALLTGISEAEILEVKQAEIHEKVRQSIHQAGWLPHLFRAIVGKARAFLQGLIRQRAMPPKPTLDIDMAEFRAMRGLMIRVRDEATSIRYLQEDVLPDLKQQLAAATGIFKTRERKDIAGQIQQTEQEISHRMDALPSIVQAEGYPDVQTFTATYRKAEAVVSQHNRELAEWERKVQERQRPAVKERPPEPRSVRERLRRLQDEGKRQQPQPHRRAVDRDSR